MGWADQRGVRAASFTAITVALMGTANACELALAFAIDVSGSVDTSEYAIQVQGLAEGLRDGAVSEALVKSRAALLFVQWTGSSRQIVSIPWTQINDFEAVEAFARRVESGERQWRNYSTAIGEALSFTLAEFASAPPCKNRVIDVSGDGYSNEGVAPYEIRRALLDAGVKVNALAIEGHEDDLTGYFWENVIVGDGAFVVTADGFADYAAKIRLKLRRETTKQVSGVHETPESGVRIARNVKNYVVAR